MHKVSRNILNLRLWITICFEIIIQYPDKIGLPWVGHTTIVNRSRRFSFNLGTDVHQMR